MNIEEFAQFSLTDTLETQYHALSKIEEVLTLEINPNLYFYAGLLSANLGFLDKSLYFYKESLKYDSNNKKALFDLGAILFYKGKYDEGIYYGERLLELDKYYDNICLHLANSYSQIGMSSKANELYKMILQENPKNFQVWSDFLLSLNYSKLSIEQRKEIYNVFKLSIEESVIRPNINPKDKIRIGYVSSDLRNHAVSYFYKGLITKHNKNNFDVYFYSTITFEDDITEVYKKDSIFRKIIDSETLYNQIKEDDIDILVDLNGFTTGNSIPLFLRNPAPIQISWIGFLNTLSLDSIPYKITDKNLIDESVLDYYSEELIILDNCLVYDPPFDLPEISDSPYLENGFITFGYFNNVRKLSKEIIEFWSEILLHHTNSKLIIIGNPNSKQIIDSTKILNSKGFFNIEIYNECDISEYMNILSKVDVAIDSFPHVGGVTTAHCLWMGVPVLTLQGKIEFERISSALLKNVGLDWFVSENITEYINKGKSLDMNYISKMRKTLREKFPSHTSVINQLEEAYTSIYKRHLIYK
jgi:predicted O-linked N-acetylglucosamine transferase (SPINDLY family)